jgi:4,5-DOPA dioxygenase extradiol
MNTLPTLFVSHGAPTLALQPGQAGAALMQLGRELPRPAAILMVSAHWETARPAVSTAEKPKTIHDFGGFPAELYRLQYPAPGAPALAKRVEELLGAGGMTADLDPLRGLDHGAWVPLRYLFPDADVPITQLSIQSHLDPAHHYRVGQLLQPLTQEGVLVIGSGSLTHNLREVRFNSPDGESAPYVGQFQDWVQRTIGDGDLAALLDYRKRAPSAVRAHPSDEHLLPLFVALGAAGAQSIGKRVTDEVTYSVVAMDTYVFEATPMNGRDPDLSDRARASTH